MPQVVEVDAIEAQATHGFFCGTRSVAGYERLFIQRVGSDQAGFFEFFARVVWPALGA